MTAVLAIVALMALWSFLSGGFSTWNMLVGAVLGVLLLSIVQRGQERSFPGRLVALVRFLLRFTFELIVSNIAIAVLALRPRPRLHPHVLAIPLRVRSDGAITFLSLAITLLPGTVAMGVSEDRATLYAHALGERDPDRAREGVTRIESLILGFME